MALPELQRQQRDVREPVAPGRLWPEYPLLGTSDLPALVGKSRSGDVTTQLPPSLAVFCTAGLGQAQPETLILVRSACV